MKRKMFKLALFASVVLAGCGGAAEEAEAPEDLRQMVEDFSSGKITDRSAAISPDQLIVDMEGEADKVYDLSKEDFFVAVAPYVSQTHP